MLRSHHNSGVLNDNFFSHCRSRSLIGNRNRHIPGAPDDLLGPFQKAGAAFAQTSRALQCPHVC